MEPKELAATLARLARLLELLDAFGRGLAEDVEAAGEDLPPPLQVGYTAEEVAWVAASAAELRREMGQARSGAELHAWVAKVKVRLADLMAKMERWQQGPGQGRPPRDADGHAPDEQE